MRISFAAFVVLFLAAPAQQRPDFSGEWRAISRTGDAPTGFSVGHGGDGRMTITQDASSFAVAWVGYSRNHKPVQSLVNLDGSERRYIDRNSIEPQQRTTRARWDDQSLVITTRSEGRGTSTHPPIETEEILTLESPSTLKVSVTR